MKEVRTIPQLAEQTGMPQWTIRKLVKDGKLKALKMGNKFYIPLAAFEDLFTAQTDDSNNEEREHA